MYPITLYLTSAIGSCIFVIVGLYEASNFVSALSNRSYDDVSMSVSLLGYVSYDDFF